MIAYENPPKKWAHLASDLFEIDGKQYLIIVDKFSKFPLVEEIPLPVTSQVVADKFRFYCSIFGRPLIIFSDNGPQYSGNAFQSFIKEWGIQHVTSSPLYSQSNGFIERQIGYVKPLIKKSLRSNSDIYKTLLNVRATPISSKIGSPAELLFGNQIATLLPSHVSVGPEDVRGEFATNRQKMVSHDAETTAKSALPPLYPGQIVRLLSHRNKRWFPGTVVGQDKSPRSYIVRSNGRTLRRNRVHIRESVTRPTDPPQPQPATKKSVSYTPVVTPSVPVKFRPRKLFQSGENTCVPQEVAPIVPKSVIVRTN